MGLLHTSGRISSLWTGSTFVTDGRKSEVFSIRQSERGPNNHLLLSHGHFSLLGETEERPGYTTDKSYTMHGRF